MNFVFWGKINYCFKGVWLCWLNWLLWVKSFHVYYFSALYRQKINPTWGMIISIVDTYIRIDYSVVCWHNFGKMVTKTEMNFFGQPSKFWVWWMLLYPHAAVVMQKQSQKSPTYHIQKQTVFFFPWWHHGFEFCFVWSSVVTQRPYSIHWAKSIAHVYNLLH